MTREKFIEGLSIMEKDQISGILYDTITRYEVIVESLKDERANMTKTHAINILSLKATIEAQEIIIKDKTAIMEAMAQPKTCDSCEYMEEVDENGWGICSNRKSWLSFGDVPSHVTCKDYEPKVQP